MHYEGKLWRPPFEANGLLVQVTLGCTHSGCTFCNMYSDKRFRVRPYEEIEEDLIMARKTYDYVPSVFLMDGNPLALSMDRLRPIYRKIRALFPEAKSINTYARYSDVLRKTPVELVELRELGLLRLTVALESGSDKVLKKVNKGFTASEAIEASDMLREADIEQWTAVILGLGGIADSDEHIAESIRVLNRINPMGLGVPALSVQKGTPLEDDLKNGLFELPTFEDVYKENIRLFKGLQIPDTEFNTGIVGPLRPFVCGGIMKKDAESAVRQMECLCKTQAKAMKQKILVNIM